MAMNLGYGIIAARDKQNSAALRIDQVQVVDGRLQRDVGPGILQ